MHPGSMTLTFRLLAAALLMLSPLLPSRAAETQTEIKTDTVPRYDVEILVYASLRPDDGEEHWQTPTALPATGQALEIGQDGIEPLSGPFKLQAIEDAMRRSSLYRPLLHWHWRQPGWERRQAKLIHVQIPAGSALPVTEPVMGVPTPQPPLADTGEIGIDSVDRPLLDGTVSLARSRYLHMAVDLIYVDPNSGIPLQLRETRRMRSGELHYLDHPRFGVLVQVTPVEGVGAGD